MRSVFIVQHLHVLPGDVDDVKLIGAYGSLTAAQAAVDRLKGQPGFRDHPRIIESGGQDPQGIYIDEYEVDKDHWTEGYVTETHEDIVRQYQHETENASIQLHQQP